MNSFRNNELTTQFFKHTYVLFEKKDILTSMPVNENIIDSNGETTKRSVSVLDYSEKVQREFKAMQESIIKKVTPTLERLLEESDYDMGYESPAEKYYNEMYNRYGVLLDTIMQNIYLKNLDAAKGNVLISHILYIIAELPKDRHNAIVMIPLAGLYSPNIEIQDLSVRCFEKWGEKEYLSILKDVQSKSTVGWFKEYVMDVIEELEKGEEVNELLYS